MQVYIKDLACKGFFFFVQSNIDTLNYFDSSGGVNLIFKTTTDNLSAVQGIYLRNHHTASSLFEGGTGISRFADFNYA